MFEFIENLRQKPNSAKKRIAFFTSLSISLVVFAVWVTVIYPDMKNNRVISETSSSTPVETLASFMSDGFSQLKVKVGEVANAFSSFASSTSMYYATSSTMQNNPELGDKSTTTEPYLEESNTIDN